MHLLCDCALYHFKRPVREICAAARTLDRKRMNLDQLPHQSEQPEKTADVSRGRHLSPRKTTSEKRAQKFHTDDVSLPRSR